MTLIDRFFPNGNERAVGETEQDEKSQGQRQRPPSGGGRRKHEQRGSPAEQEGHARFLGDAPAVMAMDEVLECHHVTGAHTLMLKIKTQDTESLEDLIDRVRSLEGVSRTETMIVLSTHMERARIAMPPEEVAVERPRRSGGRSRKGGAGGDEA